MHARSEAKGQDQDRTDPRNNESGAGFNNDHGETIEPVQACDEESGRTHTEESVEGGYKEEQPTTGWKEVYQ